MDSAYKQLIETRTPEQLYQLAHAKRFLERWSGDLDFRNHVNSGTLELSEAAAMCGCAIDVWSLQPVFHPDFVHFRQAATEADWPLTYLWNAYIGEMISFRGSILEKGYSGGVTPEFDLWRARQVVRVHLELGSAASGLVHPPLSFELSSGCSVGCWFCGISAADFKGNATLADGGDQRWRETLRAARNVLGRGVEQAFCYWATEPLDNPEYADFLEIFRDETGIVPQTTSSIPLRNIELTRRVLAMSRGSVHVPSRFSILTAPILKRVHEAFTPEELLCVELVLQNDESTLIKSRAGRVREVESGARPRRSKNPEKTAPVEATIACVSGFLVNILEGRIRLVSPTMPSDAYPDGYIVFDEGRFADAAGMEAEMRRMIAEHMSAKIAPDAPVRLAKTFRYHSKDDRSFLSTAAVTLEADAFGFVGDDLQEGTRTALELATRACERGHDPFKIVSLLRSLHQNGILETSEAEPSAPQPEKIPA